MISVIVPVYNAQIYLEKCVRSILAQTCRDLEVILVNDGSRDNSLALCQALAAEDERIRVLDGPNGGAAAARNRGLDAARGEFVAFVDSDDSIDPQMYELLLAALCENNADVAECGFIFVPDSGGPSWEICLGSRVAESREECLRQFAFFENTANGPCNKLYRRSTVGEIRFPSYAQAEDALFNLEVLLRSQRRVTIPACLYYYLQRADSGGHMSRPGHERDVIQAWREIGRKLKEISTELCPAVQHKIVDVILRQYREVLRYRPPAWRKICRRMKRDYIQEYPKQFDDRRPMTRRQKLGFAFFRISPRFYLWYSYSRKEST